jgi:hypothetical protein
MSQFYMFLYFHDSLFFCSCLQCCGTVLICCRSGSDFGKILVPVPDPDKFSSFLKAIKIAQNLAFLMPEAAYFPESWPLILDFLTFFLIFYVGSGSKSGSGTVIHSGTGSTKAVTDPQETFILRKAKLLCDFSTVSQETTFL